MTNSSQSMASNVSTSSHRRHEDLASDPGRLRYAQHNIYLNFVDTFSRQPPASAITLHQKALFTFWMSAIFLWLVFQVVKLSGYLADRGRKGGDYKEVVGDDDDIENNSPFSSTKTSKASEDDDPAEKSYVQILVKKIKDICISHDKDQPTFECFLVKASVFGVFMFYFWLCDGLRVWPKVEKQYSRDMFVFLFFLLVFVAFVFTIRKTKDQLLVRDQTEEWKGWMQVQFVWYHYFDAQEVFNSIRVYVGAYVWMTGYGNFIYFSTRKDYSIFRLIKMMFRLNFLVFCVMAVTDHVFVRYYICAMHTYWFLSVWIVMVVMNRYNKFESFIVFKFLVYIICNYVVFNVPGVFEKVFTPLLWALRDEHGGLDYWKKRATYDHWSTVVGMIVAFNYTRYQQFLTFLDKDDEKTKKLRETLRYTITAVLVVCLGIWIHYVMCKPPEQYLRLHPFLSPIPICIYTWLRNMHPVLRTYHLNLFTWLGKITLETYLSQIHIYMTDSAHRILVYLPHYPMLNFTLSTLIYIAVSYQLFHLTVFFSSFLLPRNVDVVIKNIILAGVWLLLCYVIAYSLTHGGVWTSSLAGLEFLQWKV